MNPLECDELPRMNPSLKTSGDLVVGACGCLIEKNFNIPVERHPACKVKEHQPIHHSYKKIANDKKAQLSFELKGKAE